MSHNLELFTEEDADTASVYQTVATDQFFANLGGGMDKLDITRTSGGRLTLDGGDSFFDQLSTNKVGFKESAIRSFDTQIVTTPIL